MPSYLVAIVMFVLSHPIYDIYANHIKWQKKFVVENEHQGQVIEKQDLRHSTGNVRLYIGDFFRILATRQHTFRQKQRRTWVLSIGKIC